MQVGSFDIAILGGGLSGGLIAVALAARRSELNVVVIERGERFGGNHLWSFFGSDIAPADAWLVEPLISAGWDGYAVRFPGYERHLTTAYRTVASERLDAVLRQALPPRTLIAGTDVIDAGPGSVTLADGRTLAAKAVIDARGATGLPHLSGGWQKFLGRMVRLHAPHGLDQPLVMDASVMQHDGFRFVYCLPFSPTEVFVEDTYYSDTAELDPEMVGLRIQAYCESWGWRTEAVVREERGVLPVVAGGDFAAFWQAGDRGIARVGVRAGLFQPLTSYSLPDAVRTAAEIAALPDISGPALLNWSERRAREHWSAQRFYRMLAAMLFGAANPQDRYRVLERFYRLPAPLIERLYAGRSTWADRARILAGKPPVPLGRAVKALTGRAELAPLG